MKKILLGILYIVIWFVLFNVLWYVGGWFAFRNLPEEITLKYLLWAGISDFLIFDSIMFAIGIFPIIGPMMILKEFRVIPIVCGLLEIAYCVCLMLNGSNSIWAYLVVSFGAVCGSIAGVIRKE